MFIYNSSYQNCQVMFHLDHKMSYWLYPRPVSMRLGFTGLSGIVINSMGKSIQSGDVFIFINSTRNQLKLLHSPIAPSELESTLFDVPIAEDEQKALDEEVKKMEEEQGKVIEVKAHRREVRKPVYKDLPIEETHLYPEDINLEEYVEIGVEHTDTLAIQPAKMYIKRIVRHKFVLKSSLQIKSPDKSTFLLAPLPEVLLPKCMASESLLADILIDKYVYHLPFYRVIQKYKELGVSISDSTLGSWFTSVCRKLEPLYNKHREQVLASDYIQVDESTLPVIDNEKY